MVKPATWANDRLSIWLEESTVRSAVSSAAICAVVRKEIWVPVNAATCAVVRPGMASVDNDDSVPRLRAANWVVVSAVTWSAVKAGACVVVNTEI